MAEDDKLIEFHKQLQSEIIERAFGEPAPGHDDEGEFKENVFTQLWIEYLADAGVIDEGVVCYYRRKVGSAFVKVNGYYVDDETRRLDLFTSMYRHTEGAIVKCCGRRLIKRPAP